MGRTRFPWLLKACVPNHEPKRSLSWNGERCAQVQFELLAIIISCASVGTMKFAAAILVFVLFALFLGWGIIELLKGQPWLLLASLGLFLGAFIKFGCRAH